MKFIVDESTGKKVADFLNEDYDTVFVGEEMLGASDSEIIKKARREDRIIVTNDKDFGQLAVKDGREAKGILLLRLKLETPQNKIKITEQVLADHREKLEDNLVVAKEDSTKVRPI
ncbi:MAG: hypothetical protein BRC29_00195 [Nanohaloarchaea archaeon SW_7_43_1]|nr:MAG: hypothetical protein BRC29_00195 [Nanohaloarchaea archaeon SW_7_43_1]